MSMRRSDAREHGPRVSWTSALPALWRIIGGDASDRLSSGWHIVPDELFAAWERSRRKVRLEWLPVDYESWDDERLLMQLLGPVAIGDDDAVYLVNESADFRGELGPFIIPGSRLRHWVMSYLERTGWCLFDGGDFILWCEKQPVLAVLHHSGAVARLAPDDGGRP